jgi:hypothetical protein
MAAREAGVVLCHLTADAKLGAHLGDGPQIREDQLRRPRLAAGPPRHDVRHGAAVHGQQDALTGLDGRDDAARCGCEAR